MTRQPSLRQWVLPLAVSLIALTGWPGTAEAQDPAVAQIEAALAANRSNQALQQCLQSNSDVEYFRQAVSSLERSRDPKFPSFFNCSGLGANWQEIPSGACCSVFYRDKDRNGVNAAWLEMQQCGWRAAVEQRRPAYLQAAEKCLTGAGATVAVSPQPPASVKTMTPDEQMAFALAQFGAFWSLYDFARQQQAGQDSFFVRRAGSELMVVNNRGIERPMPGFMSERLRAAPPFGVLDDRAAVSGALNSYGWTQPQVEQFWRTLQREADFQVERANFEYVNWRVGTVGHYLSKTSLWAVIGILQNAVVSSEHSSVRGTINGGGDFLDEPLPPPPPTVGRLRATQPRLLHIAWSPSFIAAPRGPEDAILLELPSGTVSSGSFARVLSDLSANRIAAISVVEGEARVRERTTGREQRVGAGQFVVVLPGVGVTPPRPIPSARLSTMRPPAPVRPGTSTVRPGTLTRNAIALAPGDTWTGTLQLEGTLALEGRLLWEKPAGGNYVLEVAVNGHRVTDPVLNKMSPMRYADGRNYPYREPNTARWLLFYSHDYAANNGPAGGGYEVKTDPGQAYRYVWNVAPMMGGNPVAQVQFTNSSNPPVPIELRLLPSEPLNRYTTTSPPATTPPPPAPSKPRDGLFGGLVDALKDVAKGVAKPSSTAGVTPPAYPPPTTSPVTYGSSSAQGVPHLAVYTVPTLLGGRHYALVVQFQDGSGRPMYPAAPLTVTVTSNDPRVVTVYGYPRPTLTLRPADPGRSVGLSWDSVNIMPASASVAGTVTLTATAPGLPAASVTVTVVPTRTPDNRGTPARTAGASVRLTVLPPITETNNQPLAEFELLDAQGQPTEVDSPGDGTLESSNPAVMEGYSGTFRNGQIGYPRGPGQTQLTVVPKRRGLTGSTATLTFIAPGSTTTELAAPPPAPSPVAPPASAGEVGQVAPAIPFGEPAITGRISNIVTARGVRNGAAVDITDTFSPEVNPIHVWFRLAGFAPGTNLTSRWTYLGGSAPLVIGTGEFAVALANDYGTFSYELAAGKRWPAGDYRIEILLDGTVVGSASFIVAGARN